MKCYYEVIYVFGSLIITFVKMQCAVIMKIMFPLKGIVSSCLDW